MFAVRLEAIFFGTSSAFLSHFCCTGHGINFNKVLESCSNNQTLSDIESAERLVSWVCIRDRRSLPHLDNGTQARDSIAHFLSPHHRMRWRGKRRACMLVQTDGSSTYYCCKEEAIYCPLFGLTFSAQCRRRFRTIFSCLSHPCSHLFLQDKLFKKLLKNVCGTPFSRRLCDAVCDSLLHKTPIASHMKWDTHDGIEERRKDFLHKHTLLCAF